MSELTSDLVTRLNECGVGRMRVRFIDFAPWENPSHMASCALRRGAGIW